MVVICNDEVQCKKLISSKDSLCDQLHHGNTNRHSVARSFRVHIEIVKTHGHIASSIWTYEYGDGNPIKMRKNVSTVLQC